MLRVLAADGPPPPPLRDWVVHGLVIFQKNGWEFNSRFTIVRAMYRLLRLMETETPRDVSISPFTGSAGEAGTDAPLRVRDREQEQAHTIQQRHTSTYGPTRDLRFIYDPG